MDMKLEVIVIPVSDVDRAKAFYEKLGFRLDIDVAPNENYRALQLTPPNSDASIIFGKGVTNAKPGSIDRILLAVNDIAATRDELVSRGVEVSEVFHDAFGSLGAGFRTGTEGRAPGPDPQHRSYGSYASFSDPDGNVWLLQEITTRLPGREWKREGVTDIPTLAALLRETGEHHDHFEKSHADHQWSDWYAPYISARQNGSSPDAAAAAATEYMEQVKHVLPK